MCKNAVLLVTSYLQINVVSAWVLTALLLLAVSGQSALLVELNFENNLNNDGTGPATISPDTSVTYGSPRTGTASLDTDFVTEDQVTVDSFTANVNGISITTWVLLQSSANFDSVFSVETASGHFMNLEVWGTGTAMFSKNGIPGGGSVSSGTALDVGSWHHLAWVANTSTHFLYIDGVLVDSDSWTANSAITEVQIGSQADETGDQRQTDALIDNFRIYDEALDLNGVLASMAVPEPTSLSLIISGLLVIRGLRKKYVNSPRNDPH